MRRAGAVVSLRVAPGVDARLDADDIASAILRGMDEGQHVILTDPEARAAVAAKTHARPEYDEQQFAFAERISGRQL